MKKVKDDGAFELISPLPEKFQQLPLGEIKPLGWIKTQMQQDMAGFTGNLDRLVPDLMEDSIYGKDRLTKKIKDKNVGNLRSRGDVAVQYLWWNSETQSNWRDGYIRNAILLQDKTYLENAEKYIRYIRSTQDVDGYLGIYDRDLRYQYTGENGELWSKTTLLRGLLAWYDYTKNDLLLTSIKKAVTDLMDHYPAGNSSPFKSADPVTVGLSHGLAFTDVLDRLYELTGDQAYRKYALFLYEDYSRNTLSEQDVQYKNITNPGYKLKGHGAHTYEHLRPLTVAAYASGNPGLVKALEIYLRRIGKELTPSGGPVSDEWVAGRAADATETGYEYCSIHELMTGYCGLLQKSGDPIFGDLAERIFFNAAQGSRHPSKSCIAYCKTDNSYAMTGTRNGMPQGKNKETRFKYSPAHQDVAVCCVPNAGRITPYYVQSMWMKQGDTLVATLPGPCELHTILNDHKISIIEETDYPYSLKITYRISVDEPVEFGLMIRIPGWATAFECGRPYIQKGQYIAIRRKWGKNDSLNLDLKTGICTSTDFNNEKYFTWGALVFAHPVKSKEITGRKYLEGFYDLNYKPLDTTRYAFIKNNKARLEYHDSVADPRYRVQVNLELYNKSLKKPEQVTLVPLGTTLLRQVTF